MQESSSRRDVLLSAEFLVEGLHRQDLKALQHEFSGWCNHIRVGILSKTPGNSAGLWKAISIGRKVPGPCADKKAVHNAFDPNQICTSALWS